MGGSSEWEDAEEGGGGRGGSGGGEEWGCKAWPIGVGESGESVDCVGWSGVR